MGGHPPLGGRYRCGGYLKASGVMRFSGGGMVGDSARCTIRLPGCVCARHTPDSFFNLSHVALFIYFWLLKTVENKHWSPPLHSHNLGWWMS
jgi:hypothetical protein